jgi:hypothetical protein
MNRDARLPGPGSYKTEKHLNTVGTDVRFASAMKTVSGSSFGKSKRFVTPTWK